MCVGPQIFALLILFLRNVLFYILGQGSYWRFFFGGWPNVFKSCVKQNPRF